MKPTHNIDWEFIDSHPMADKPDEDSPELTDEDFTRMRPASEALPEIHICVSVKQGIRIVAHNVSFGVD